MRFRVEVFVADVRRSVRFYEGVLGFELVRSEPDYASLRGGAAELGLGPIAKLPARSSGPGFTQERLATPNAVAPAWSWFWRSMISTLLSTPSGARATPSSSRRANARGACGTSASRIPTATTSA
jgi:catechol 2,3-dioxygenase-like lactoylglutathione lyase family enzyme